MIENDLLVISTLDLYTRLDRNEEEDNDSSDDAKVSSSCKGDRHFVFFFF